RSALEVAANRWRNDAVFRCMKTELLFPYSTASSPADRLQQRDAMCRLENYVLAAGIQGSRWTEQRAWTYRVGSTLDDMQLEADNELDDMRYAEFDNLRRSVAAP